MARRSSQRLRNRNSSTPKRVSLSHDAASARTPRTAPVKLSAVREDEYMPGAFPSSVSPPPPKATHSSINAGVTTIPVKFDDSTPKHATPIQPSHEEMHSKLHQRSTAKPLDEVRWLRLSNMAPYTAPPRQSSKIATLQDTPSKSSKSIDFADSPRFQFSLGREVSLELSPEAKKLMLEKREEANRIREQMLASGYGSPDATNNSQRKIATPKGKKGRFSEVHQEGFMSMDSIASHPSALRSSSSKPKAETGSALATRGMQPSQEGPSTPSKSLKHSPSKAQLDETEPQQHIYRSTAKAVAVKPSSNLPRSASAKSLHFDDSLEGPSPSKRIKRSEADDVTRSRPMSTGDGRTPPAQLAKDAAKPSNDTDMSNFNSPTRASLARASSVKSTKSSKVPGPSMYQSPPKASFADHSHEGSKQSTQLLVRSPAKMSVFSSHGAEKPKSSFSPLLMRSPFKVSPPKKPAESTDDGEEKPNSTRLLSRTPLKLSTTDTIQSKVDTQHVSPTPLLARSPSKIPLVNEDTAASSNATPGKLTGNIMGRFNLLRTSPVKSILRSPQRLYSNDPAKIAAGTHFASPASAVANKAKPLPENQEGTPSFGKRVDFTSSTKARYERAQSEAESTPSKGPTPPPKDGTDTNLPRQTSTTEPPIAKYPTLPIGQEDQVVTPQKRRQTAAPFDFTFTSHGSGIVFGQSPNAPASTVNSKRPSTIRHVSAEPQLSLAPAEGTKKRKFDFENEQAQDEEIAVKVGGLSDKENAVIDEDERPAKRVKPNVKEPAPAKPATRLPTLGVRPKKTTKDGKDVRPKTISKARLNALAQPKRRA